MPHLIVLSGPDSGKSFELSGQTVSVGRHSINAIQLSDYRVSRRHLEFRALSTGGWQLFDLDSGNGTQVNGRTVQVVDLYPGDQIALGESVLLFDADGVTASSPSMSDRLRLVVRPATENPAQVLRSLTAEAGSQILTHPERTSEWVRIRLASLAVLYEATSAVSHILDVDELLGRILDLVLQTTGADHGCALLTDHVTGELQPRTVRSRSGMQPGELIVSRSVVDHVLREKQGVLVADAGSDERFRDGASIARHQIREVICVPMKGRHETVGVLFLSSCSGQSTGGVDGFLFSEDHLTLAIAIAHQAALAIEETRYYQALVQAEKLAAVGQTISALSHHIKNIMQGVRFGGDMVRMALDGDDRDLLLKGWKLVEKNQSRIDELILDMLSYSKDREPAIEPIALNALVEDVLDVVRGRAAEGGVALDCHPSKDLPVVPCDPDGIHRALLNVVSNAVDAVAGRESPRVLVDTGLALDGSHAEVAVTDNGPGISPEKQEEIFKPFVSSKGSKGTGLGLPVSRKILREHGGDVILESSEGCGCRFVLMIPLRRQNEDDSSIPHGPVRLVEE